MEHPTCPKCEKEYIPWIQNAANEEFRYDICCVDFEWKEE